MDLASKTYLLKKEDASLMDSNKIVEDEKQKLSDEKTYKFKVSFDFLTQAEIFVINNLNWFSCCVRNRKKKTKIVEETN